MKTHVAIILDKSGSMAGTKDATVVGYNEQVQQLKKIKDGQEVLVSLVTFDGEVYEHLWEVPVDQISEASAADYNPDGSTAMCDAMCYVIEKYQKTTDQNESGAAYIIITITDGETNADKCFKVVDLKNKIAACEENKKWTFTMIGCGSDYLKQLGDEIGIKAANMAMWDNTTTRGTYGALKKVAANIGSFVSAGYSSRSAGVAYCANVQSVEDDAMLNLCDNSDITDEELISKGLTPDDQMQAKPFPFGTPSVSCSCSSGSTGIFGTGQRVELKPTETSA